MILDLVRVGFECIYLIEHINHETMSSLHNMLLTATSFVQISVVTFLNAQKGLMTC